MKRIYFLASTALVGLLVAPAARAQTAPALPPVADAAPDDPAQPRRAAQTAAAEDIIVTAQKRAETLTTVPVAVSVFTSESRERIGIETLSDYANFTPGLSYSPGSDRVFLRGVGRQTNTAGSDAGVATYSDGVYNGSTSSIAGDELFLERTEILRGPQGTLYGRNSIGGAINVISRRPTDSLYAEARANVGNYDTYRAEAALSGPVAEGVRLRLAGLYADQGDGYYRNTAGGEGEGGRGSVYYIEGQAEFDFAPNATGWIKAFTGASTTFPHASNIVDAYDASPYPAGLLPGAAFGLLIPGVVQGGTGTVNPGIADARTFSADTLSRARTDDNYGVTAHLNFTGDGFDVRYIGGYQQYRFRSRADIDQTSVTSYTFPLIQQPFPICAFIPGCTGVRVFPTQQFNFSEKKQFYSHELNISSNGTGPLQYILGAYYYHEDYDQSSGFNAPNQPQLRAPVNGPANPSGDYVTAISRIETSSYAAFGQADYKITDAFRLTVGLRYTEDHKRGSEQFRAICFGVPACGSAAGIGSFSAGNLGTSAPTIDVTSALVSTAPAPGVVSTVTTDPMTGRASRRLRDSWNALTGTAAIEYQPDDDMLAYLRYSRGYKSGGFNAGAVSALPETDAEHVDAFEGGLKRRIAGRLTANAAAFLYDYTGLQVPLTVPVGGVPITSFVNIPKARSYGFELETLWSPVDNLQLLLSYGYLNAKVRETTTFIDASAPGAGAGVTARGQDLPDSPRNKLAANASYKLNLQPGSITVSGSYIWRDNSFGYIFNRPFTEARSYDQVDLRALLTDRNDRFTLILFVRNVFDSYGYNSPVTVTGTPPTGPARQFNLTPPRTFGAQFQIRFR